MESRGQMSLPGLDATAPLFRPDVVPDPGGKLRGYVMFLAIFPEPEDAHHLARMAADLRSVHALAGTPLSPSRLHISLHAIAGFVDTIPQDVVDAVRAASAGVACPSLRIVFDRVLSFTDSNAFVLRCTPDSDAAVAQLRQSLAVALRLAGLRPEPSRTPHMTMLYDSRHIPEQAIEPLCWTATRFALVLSHVGIGHHQWIAEWPLADHR